MATATETALDLIKSELEAHMPAACAAQGVTAPATYNFGSRILHPVTSTPAIDIDVLEYSQGGGFGTTTKRDTSFAILAVAAAANEDALHELLIRYADIITGTLEAEVTFVGGSKLTVTDVEFSPSFREGSGLFRAVLITAQLANKLHTRGSI